MNNEKVFTLMLWCLFGWFS